MISIGGFEESSVEAVNLDENDPVINLKHTN